MDWSKQRIAVLYGGPSAEREVSLRSGEAMHQALLRRGYNAVAIDVDRHIAAHLQKNQITAAVLALHGELGEDGAIQGLLELMGIPYSGSNVSASALCMDKGLSKRLYRSEGLPTPAWIELAGDAEEADDLVDHYLGEFPGDAFVKPLDCGSSVGISHCPDKDALIRGVAKALSVSRRVMVERAIHGRELTLTMIDGETLPIIEIKPKKGFYDYTNKYTPDQTEYEVPAKNLAQDAQEAVTQVGLAAYHLSGCRGLARADFMLDDEGTPWLLELNTIPGMTETSLAPKAAAAAGMDFDDLVERILQGARLR
uniref:D-alanine--D-alanine ligase n=1 Tax=Magnetococcus massalia (strain MO-1) TaxID=451514 RepID=A0A1S7LLY8_MAGMO|nr:D-alanine--D-alanine ligase [Candidatus Magnetococcus massalia]